MELMERWSVVVRDWTCWSGAIEEWESILSGEMELDGTLLARLETMMRFNDLLHPV